MFDVLIRGGSVVDGTGSPAVRADVGVQDGSIDGIGLLPDAEGRTEIDAAGCLVFPGFVDAHVHGDGAVLEPDVQLAALRQGITTFVLGQDGLSFAPAGPATLRYVTRYFAAVNGVHPALDDGPTSVADLLATYDRRTPLNTAYLVPQGTVRHAAMGAALRPPDADELARMRKAVERGLAEGAVGLSTGLEYPPGRYADAAEIAELCRPVAAAGLPYVTHMRGYENLAPDGMAEVVEIARTSGVGAHVSHYHGPADVLTRLVDDALDAGLDLTFDSYPYLRGSTTLAMVTLPYWLPAADIDATVAALQERSVRARLETEWFAHRAEVWPRIVLSHVPSGGLRWAEGRPLLEAAERVGASPGDFCCDVLIATGLEAGCVFDHPPTNTDESIRALLRHPVHMAGSDGIYRGGHPHPRGWGTFARLLARHVRELGDWTWEQAAVHLAARPARRFRLGRRGLVQPGYVADLAIVDPQGVADRATYETPRQPAAGISHVLVGGIPVLADGELTTVALPGRAITPG